MDEWQQMQMPLDRPRYDGPPPIYDGPRHDDPQRLSKQDSLKVVRSLKRGLLLGSIIAFGSFSWLAANHQIGNAAIGPSAQPEQHQPGGQGFHHHRGEWQSEGNQQSGDDAQQGGQQGIDPQQNQGSQQGGGYGFGSGQQGQSPQSGSGVS